MLLECLAPLRLKFRLLLFYLGGRKLCLPATKMYALPANMYTLPHGLRFPREYPEHDSDFTRFCVYTFFQPSRRNFLFTEEWGKYISLPSHLNFKMAASMQV